jgi:glutamate--cysteine ligase catalytic subunit
MNQVDENMQRSQQRNAAVINSFFFRKNVFPLDRLPQPYNMASRPASPPASGYSTPAHSRTSSVAPTPHPHPRRSGSQCSSEEEEESSDECIEMTLDEIINGRGESFPGLMGLVNAYLNGLNVDVGTKCELRRYLDLIKYRAKGAA